MGSPVSEPMHAGASHALLSDQAPYDQGGIWLRFPSIALDGPTYLRVPHLLDRKATRIDWIHIQYGVYPLYYRGCGILPTRLRLEGKEGNLTRRGLL